MKRFFGLKKEKKESPPSIQDISDRINKRGDAVKEKIKKLDAELGRYKEQIKKTRPGRAQEAVKARAMTILKQKRVYEGQRDMLCNQSFELDQVAFAADGIKDAQQIEQGDLAKEHKQVVGKNLKLLLMGQKVSKIAASTSSFEVAIVSLGRKEGVAQFPFMSVSRCIPGKEDSGELFVGKTRKELGLKPDQ